MKLGLCHILMTRPTVLGGLGVGVLEETEGLKLWRIPYCSQVAKSMTLLLSWPKL